MDLTSFFIGLGAGLGLGIIGVVVAVRHTTLSMMNAVFGGMSKTVQK